MVRGGCNLSSRVVENLYWFGRYAERCDKTSRLLRVALSRLLDGGAGTYVDTCQRLFELLDARVEQVREVVGGSRAGSGDDDPARDGGAT